MVRQPTREELTRYGAPAAFLLGVTIAVILIHAGLSSGGSQARTGPPPATTPRNPTTRAATTRKATTQSSSTQPGTTATTTTAGVLYTVQSGDTLGAIAARYGTTSQAIEALNPGVNPAALQPGQQIRVK